MYVYRAWRAGLGILVKRSEAPIQFMPSGLESLGCAGCLILQSRQSKPRKFLDDSLPGEI